MTKHLLITHELTGRRWPNRNRWTVEVCTVRPDGEADVLRTVEFGRRPSQRLLRMMFGEELLIVG